MEVIGQAANSQQEFHLGEFNPEIHANTPVAKLVYEWDPTCDLSKLKGVELTRHEQKSREEAHRRYGQPAPSFDSLPA